jgi:hypothetical protein
MKRKQIIAPRLTLPMKPAKRRKGPRRSLRQALWIYIRELAFLLIAGDIANMAFWYLAPWPVYRIVSFVVIFILWSNAASSTARVKTKQTFDMLNTMSTQAVHAVKRPRTQAAGVKTEHTLDTTAYLVAIKKEHYANIQTGNLYDTLPDDHSYRDLLHHPETAPTE